MGGTDSTSCPRVSIGLPVYNGETYVEEALRSIQAQTLDDIEILVSNNASTDRTSEIVSDIALTDPRIQVFTQERNLGAAPNYNLVFRKSRAPYFRWVAADDRLAPTLLEKSVALLDENLRVVLAYPKTELIDADGAHVSFYDDNMDLPQNRRYQRACACINRMNLCNAALGVHRSDALSRTHLIQPFPSSDAVLLFEIALHGQIRELKEPLFHRRVHKGASVEANHTASERQAWFDPSIPAKRRRLPTRLRLLLEYLKIIQQFPTSSIERSLISASIVGVWSFRRGRVNIGRWRRKLTLPNCELATNKRFPDLN